MRVTTTAIIPTIEEFTRRRYRTFKSRSRDTLCQAARVSKGKPHFKPFKADNDRADHYWLGLVGSGRKLGGPAKHFLGSCLDCGFAKNNKGTLSDCPSDRPWTDFLHLATEKAAQVCAVGRVHSMARIQRNNRETVIHAETAHCYGWGMDRLGMLLNAHAHAHAQ